MFSKSVKFSFKFQFYTSIATPHRIPPLSTPQKTLIFQRNYNTLSPPLSNI